MPRRNWKRFHPNSLRAALQGCLDFARERHNRSIQQVSDLMGLKSHWTLYKWLESGRMPATLIRPFEHACGATFVSEFLALSAGKITIDIPTGQRPTAEDLLALQEVCSLAVRELLRFAKEEKDPDRVVAAITPALEQLCWHRRNVQTHIQPELDL